MGSDLCREFRRLRAASFFPSDGKETKGSPEDGSEWTLRVHIRLTPGPLFTGVTPWGRQRISGAQNQECLSAVPSGPTGGLSGQKFWTGAVPILRLPSPNQRSRSSSRRRGGPCGRL